MVPQDMKAEWVDCILHFVDTVLVVNRICSLMYVSCLDIIIEEFVSGGPKNYAYKTIKAETLESKTVCKVRGITLNYTPLSP